MEKNNYNTKPKPQDVKIPEFGSTADCLKHTHYEKPDRELSHQIISGFCWFVIPFILFFINGCENDIFQEEAELFDVEIKVKYPDYYNVDRADSVLVRLINKSNKLSSEQYTDENGEVVFKNVTKGGYRLSASKKLSAEKAIEMGETIVDEEHVADGRNVSLNQCVEDLELNNTVDIGTIELLSSLPGEILIEEVFYTGSATLNGRAYYSDHFVEIFNNTDEIIYADSLCVANVYGANGSVDSNPTEFKDDQDNVYLTFVWMVPGNGSSHPIMPGESFIIAQDGINHKTDPNGNPNSIDLSGADWETFLEREVQKDIDVSEVPNMIEIFASRPNTHDWVLHSYGPGIVLFKADNPKELEVVPEPYNTQGYMLMKLPVENVLDAFESLAYPNSGMYKRIPDCLDAGFISCDGIFNKQSCRRKIMDVNDGRIILQDTNNSGEDFEVIDSPAPKKFDVNF